jgi:hypothetical protein
MTTPSINTPYGIIADAMQDAGFLQDGNEPNSEQLAKNMRRLRDLINTWQTQGLKLWLLSDTEVPITAGQAVYTFKPAGSVNITKPLRVIQGYFLLTTSEVRRPLTVLSWDEYLRLGQAGTAAGNRGAINSYFVDKRATELAVTFWLTPDATEVLNGDPHVLLQIQADAPVNLTATTAFPEEWRMALRWGLADDICTGQPQAIMDRCSQKAEMYRRMLEDWDVEDAPTMLQPDPRSQYAAGRFR